MKAQFGDGWQDFVVVCLQISFIIAMIPTIMGPNKPEFYTALFTAAAVTGFVYVYATIRWWLTVFFTAILAIEWWVVAYQAA